MWNHLFDIRRHLDLDLLGSSETIQKACLLHSPYGNALKKSYCSCIGDIIHYA